jgi:hypothetical protein
MADTTPPGPQPVSGSRAALYARLMEAQERIADDRYRRSVSDVTVQAALDAVDERLTTDARREDLYLGALAIYVAELGGRLELRAVFGDGPGVELPGA